MAPVRPLCGCGELIMDNALHREPIAQLLAAARSAEEAGSWETALELYHEGLQLWEPGTPQAAELLRKVGLIHYYRGDHEIALNLFESSRRVAEQVGFSGLTAQALNCLGIVRQALGQLDLAEDLYLHAYVLARGLDDSGLMLMIDQNLAIVACIRGNTEQAMERYASVLSHFRMNGDAHGTARVLINIGMLYIDLEQWSAAENVLNQALAEASLASDRETFGTLQLNRAELYLKLQRFDDARACCDQAFEIFARLDSRSGLCETYKTYGMMYRESGKLHLSETHFALAIGLAKEADQSLLEGEVEIEFALTHLTQGRNREALQSLNRAYHLFAALETGREVIHMDRQLQRLASCYLQVVQAWGESAEAGNRYTGGHSVRVTNYTCRLAEELGFSSHALLCLRLGALMHDVGNVMVSSQLLHNTGALDPREWEEVRTHVIAGDEIVAELEFPHDIRSIVRSHHERWDGTGYPDQLAGEQIPIAARLLCIADIFDTLTTSRSYRRALPAADALDFMHTMAGTILDPTLLAIFRNLIETGAIDLRPHLPAQFNAG